ncbi:MAG: DNA repair protein RecO [Spirochaetia bacterium]|nr:DNA repair protein RecO [Spirochaetota bacterium]MCX8097209.1 DNA repair protein RecO [Spirochaetota bacterium]MDW8111963.1 DNA repair protein RecO [Spirochaetia bacterium]
MYLKRFQKITGIVLGTKDIGDFDKIVVILSPEIGKSNLALYGANRFKSRFSNIVNMCNVIRGLVRYSPNPEKIPSLQEAEMVKNFFDHLKIKTSKLYYSILISEVSNLVIPYEVFDEDLYNLLVMSLNALVNSDSDEEDFIVVSKFLISLLKIQGVLPYIKNENIGDRTKVFIISILKGNDNIKTDRNIKYEFLKWFLGKLSVITGGKEVISIHLVKEII